MKNKNRHLVKNVIGTLTIPVLVAVLLQGICMFNGKTMISNMTGFDNFVVYIAIVMITTIALSINLNSGRFDFSLGSMAALSSVLGAKITYSILGDDLIWYVTWTCFRTYVCGAASAANHYISWSDTDL